MPPFLSNIIDSVVGTTILLPIAIICCALILEDLTTIIVGMLAAEGLIGIPTGLISVYIGIMLGDATLYSIGALARTHPRLAHYIDHDYTNSFKAWLERRYVFTVFSGHFVPGLRMTTYIASGFFRRPLRLFIPTAIAGGIGLGTLLFIVSYLFGSLTTTWIRPARWAIAAVFIVVLFLVAKKQASIYRPHENKKSSSETKNLERLTE